MAQLCVSSFAVISGKFVVKLISMRIGSIISKLTLCISTIVVTSYWFAVLVNWGEAHESLHSRAALSDVLYMHAAMS